MGYFPSIDRKNRTESGYRTAVRYIINKKIPIWQLPKNTAKIAIEFDSDDTRWLEQRNQEFGNEIDMFIKSSDVKVSDLRKYIMNTKKTIYDDDSAIVENTTNKYKVTEVHNSDSEAVFIKVENRETNNTTAELIYNENQDEGRKIIYSYGKTGDNKFEVVKIYNFKPSKMKTTDIVNYIYTSNIDKFTQGCEFKNEYYLLNGKEVKAEKIDDRRYKAVDENGNTLIFIVRE